MKKTLLFSFALSAVFALSSCKSQESAYRQAYNKAREQDASQTDNGRATGAVGQQDNGVTVTPVTPPTSTGRPTEADETGWFRVIASSFEDKASAVQSRNELRNKYAGAWLLYRK